MRLTRWFNSAGSVFALAGATLGPRAGFFAGFALMGTYTLFTIASAAEVGLFGQTFLDGIGAGNVDWLIIGLSRWCSSRSSRSATSAWRRGRC